MEPSRKWQADCAKFGMNWENWQAISFPDSLKNYSLQFYISSMI
jgi:hypothetical protein